MFSSYCYWMVVWTFTLIHITWITTLTSYPIWFRVLRSGRRNILCVEREFCVVGFLLSDALVKWKVVQCMFLSARSHASDPPPQLMALHWKRWSLSSWAPVNPFLLGSTSQLSRWQETAYYYSQRLPLTSLPSEGNLSQLLLKQAANQLVASGT